MADESVTHDECVDDPDEGFDQGDNQLMEHTSTLTEFERILKYARSSNVGLRQMAVLSVIDILKSTPPRQLLKGVPEIMKVLVSFREESILDAELKNEVRNDLRSVLSDIFIPLVVRNIGCTDVNAVMPAQAALLQLIEQGFISKPQIEIKVCPSILALSKGETPDCIEANTRAVTIMGKLAQHLGRDVMERIFLKRFTELCASPMFCVRKTCAGIFGEFSSVVGTDTVENVLLPCYISLCSDEAFEVRKSCAESITYMSCACSLTLRKEVLAPTIVNLLEDESRWVRKAAYRSLGPFISTFADPSVTSMMYNKDGELVLTNRNGQEFVIYKDVIGPISSCIDGDYDSWNSFKEQYEDELLTDVDVIKEESCDNNISQALNKLHFQLNDLGLTDDNVVNDRIHEYPGLISQLTNSLEECNVSKEDNRNVDKVNNVDVLEDDLHLFNSNIYWHISPELPLDPSIIAAKDPSVGEASNSIDAVGVDFLTSNETYNNGCVIPTEGNGNVHNEPEQDILSNNDAYSNGSTVSLEDDGNYNCEETDAVCPVNKTCSIDSTMSLEENGNCDTILQDSLNTLQIPPQNVVPQALIEHFISMTGSDLLSKLDIEMPYYCAYSLPAVALTLGGENWHILKGTVDYLASDLQYKVRKTLASSLHELAMILGPELATEKLAPLFEGFIKDLDVVRIGVLEHLAEFFELIDPVKRTNFLPRLVEFLRTDHKWNWRFRDELGRQLLRIVNMFKPTDTAKYIGVIAIDLLCDKVAAVRQVALTLVAKILKHISTESILTSTLLMRLAEHFAHSKKWKRRQTFCLLCEEILKEKSLQPSRFASDLMPHLLDLSWDSVVNVRLVVARCVAVYIITNDYFTDPNNEHCDGLEVVLRRLQADKDRDVRSSAAFVTS